MTIYKNYIGGGPSNDEGSDWSCVVTPMQLRILSNANAVTEIFPVLRPHTFDSKEWTECDLTSIAWESLMDGFYPDERRAEGYLTLEVRFKIKLMEPGTVIEIGEDMDLKGLQEEAHTDLMNDMTKLLLETESDLILVSRDGEEVPCHGLILTARCPPFKAMLASGLKETEERRVEITDVGTEELKLLVKFLYTGDITEDVEDIAGTGTDVMKGVLIAADKYELPQLMKYAAHGLKLRRCSKDAWELLECLKMYENELPDAVKEWKQFVIQNVREIVGV